MFKRVAVPLAVLLAVALAALGGAAVASADDGPVPLSPDDASALIAGPATSGVTTPVSVDAATALSASSLPGAVTSVESDMTLEDAVGLDPAQAAAAVGRTTGSSSLTVPSSTPKSCWASSAWDQWGTWPYQQKLMDTTYWCAVYGSKVTYRTSSVTGGGTICGLSWRASQLIGGGVGYHSFTMRTSGGFSCPTAIPWIVLHPSHYLEVRRNDVGASTVVAYG